VPELLWFVIMGVWIYCLVDILTTRREEVRNLPKWAWFLLAFLILPLGVPLWFLFGRPPRTRDVRERWSSIAGGDGGSPRVPRPHVPRRARPPAPESVEDEATIRARIVERDALLARWAEEDQRRERGDGPTR
jgi:hypothetical protein